VLFGDGDKTRRKTNGAPQKASPIKCSFESVILRTWGAACCALRRKATRKIHRGSRRGFSFRKSHSLQNDRVHALIRFCPWLWQECTLAQQKGRPTQSRPLQHSRFQNLFSYGEVEDGVDDGDVDPPDPPDPPCGLVLFGSSESGRRFRVGRSSSPLGSLCPACPCPCVV